MYMLDSHQARRDRQNQVIADAARKLDAALSGEVFPPGSATFLDVFAAAGELHAAIKAADGL